MKKGFTLLEITVALTIFSIGIMAVLTLFTQGAKMRKTEIIDMMKSFSSDNLLEQKKKELENSDSFLLSDILFSENKHYPVFNSTEPQESDAGIYVFDENNNNLFDFIYAMKITDHSSLSQIKQIQVSLKEQNNNKIKSFYAYVARKK